jgi:hypothetical protein
VLCRCDPPQVFEGSETCNTCGRIAVARIYPSTSLIAEAIVEVVLGRRPLGGHHQGAEHRDALRDQE